MFLIAVIVSPFTANVRLTIPGRPKARFNMML
jgi:hypothetical protein